MLKKKLFSALAVIVSSTVVLAPVHADTINTVNIALHDAKVNSVVFTGTFEGRNDHITKGQVSIVRTANGYVAILDKDFSLDGAPAPTLGFGKNGFDKSTEFAKLKSKNGLQVYAIPKNIKVEDFNEFYVWCSDFSVALGVAKLK